jgi:hypothetical protein
MLFCSDLSFCACSECKLLGTDLFAKKKSMLCLCSKYFSYFICRVDQNKSTFYTLRKVCMFYSCTELISSRINYLVELYRAVLMGFLVELSTIVRPEQYYYSINA